MIQNPLAMRILDEEFLPGDVVVVDRTSGGDLTFRKGP